MADLPIPAAPAPQPLPRRENLGDLARATQDFVQEAPPPLPDTPPPGTAVPDAANTPAAPRPARRPKADLPQPPTQRNGVRATDDPPDFSDTLAAGWRLRTIETDAFNYTNRIEDRVANGLFGELPSDAQDRLRARGYNPDTIRLSTDAVRARLRAALFDEARAAGLQAVPSDEDMFQDMITTRRRAEWEEASQNTQGIGGFLGGMARDVVDPINLMLAPFGVTGTIAKTFAAESVLGGVAAGLGLPREFAVADELDLPKPNALARIGTEAAASGVLGTLPVALVRGAQAFKTRRRIRREGKPPEVPQYVHDEAQAEAEARLRDELPDRLQARPAQGAGQGTGQGAAQPAALPDFDFSATGNASPRTNRTGYVFGKLIENGVEPHIAAGIVGNLMAEAGTGLNPRINEAVPLVPGSRGGFGLAQWTGPRRRQLEGRYDDPGNIDNQIDFLLHETATTEAAAWARVRRASTAAEAAALFSQHFLRPGIPHLDRRIGYAQGIIDQYEGGKVPKGAATAPSSYVPMERTRAGYTSAGQVRTAAGTRIDVEYQVVDASTLTRASGDLQPRDRSLANSDEQIANMAATLDPVLLMPAPTADRGAPIVGPDNVIESGNGRFGAIIRAAEQNPDRMDAYRQQIEAAGFEIPDDVHTPVLVGRRTSDLDDAARRAFVVEAQDSGVARMTPVERGRAEAAMLDPGTLSRLDPSRPLDDDANGGFLRAALDRMPRTERNAFVTPEGRLNADGRKALERALFARAFNDPDLLRRFTEGDAAELRSLLDALFEASPAWARLVADVADGQVKPEFDITGHVIEAMRLIGQARKLAATENLRMGNVLAELLDEIDLVEGAVSPLTRALVSKFWADGRAAPRAKIADFLTRFANEARKVGRTDAGLFDAPDVIDVLRKLDGDTFADLTETGPARSTPQRPEPVVEDVLPEEAYTDGAQSPEAIEADALAEADLRAAVAAGNSAPESRQLVAEGDSARAVEYEWQLKRQQPVETIDDIYDLAPEADRLFDVLGREIEAATAARFSNPGIKDRAKTVEKMPRKKYRHVNQLADVVRGAFIITDPAQAEDVVARLAADHNVLDQGWSTNAVGYADRKVILQADNGLLIEVQLQTPEMHRAKQDLGGHELYQQSRSLPDDAIEERAALDQQQRELYSAALAREPEALRIAFSKSSGPKILENRSAKALSEGSTRPVSATSSASTGSQSPPGSTIATAERSAPLNSTAGRPSQSMNLGSDDVMGNTSTTDITPAAQTYNTLSSEILADGDFDVPIGEGQTISARALLDDIDDDMALDTVIATCSARTADA